MARALVKKNSPSGLGSVKQSILTEAQFQAIHGVGWVLMDGRDITGSDLATITGDNTLPDARGMHLRGKNNGRADGSEDPAGERALGHFQDDAMQGHFHNFRYRGGLYGGSSSSTMADRGFGGNSLLDDAKEAVTDGTNGTPRTASETRPKNIAVNIFIKINEE